MTAALLAVAGVALAIERVAYVAIWRHPDAFARACRRVWGLPDDPVLGVRALFVVFKGLQVATFLGWCWVQAGTLRPQAASWPVWAAAAALVVAGQVLNVSVFAALGTEGVFYGRRFGRRVRWHRGFPFSLLAHPQYVGTVLSIWGFFLLMRHPHQDWWLVPCLETVYYAAGSRLER